MAGPSFDPNKLQRDGEYIQSLLEIGNDDAVYTKEDLIIQVPTRFQERNLATVSSEGTYVLGMTAMIAGDKYAVNMTCALMRLTPTTTDTVMVGDEEYYQFHFDKGTKVYNTIHLVKENTLVYYVYEEFIMKGRFPWYISYQDKSRIFDSAPYHAGVRLAHPLIIDLLIQMTSRDPKELTRLYREIIEDYGTLKRVPDATVPFNSVLYNTHSTTSRLIGAYFSEGINSTLVNPSSSVDRLEGLLRE